MIGGNTRVNSDVPPYFLYSDFNVTAVGLNLVGLRRAGFTAADVAALKTAYKIAVQIGLKLEEALARIEGESRPSIRCIWSRSSGRASAGSVGSSL